jgi:hypothetical protein
VPEQELLVIDGHYPSPDRDSGSVSMTNFLRVALRLGFRISYTSAWSFAETGPYRAQLEALGIHTVAPPQHESIAAFLQANGSRFAACFLSRHNAGGDYLSLVRMCCPQAKIIFNPVDLHHLREARAATLTEDADAMLAATVTRDHELALIANADATVVVSEEEQVLPETRVRLIPLLHDSAGKRNGFGARADIGFIGSFQHAPNGDAVRHFLKDIWPPIRAKLPGVHFRVVGSDMPEDFAARKEGVVAVGHVVDLDVEFERIRLTVAPLRFGAGAKGKIVTSLAHGVPCVVSPIAAEGMAFVDGEHVLVGSDPVAFADRVVELYQDEARWNALSNAGLDLVRRKHSLERGEQHVRELMTEIGVLPRRQGLNLW